MPLNKIYKESFELGYNNRDFPTDISPKSCQLLENAFPGVPNLRPRNGITQWNTFSEISNIFDDPTIKCLEVIPWDEELGTVILIDSNFRFWRLDKSDSPPLMFSEAAIAFHPKTKFSWTKIQNSLYIITNYTSNNAAFIIEEIDSVLTLRNANIDRPAGTIALDAVTTASPDLDGVDKTFTFVWTLVRRPEYPQYPTVNPKYPNDAFSAGDLESISSTTHYETFTQSTGSGFRYNLTLSSPVTDPQINFIRVYVSALGETPEITEGFEKQWFTDIPITSPGQVNFQFLITNDDFTNLIGSLDTLKTIGYDKVPSGSSMTSHLGRLWIGGETEDGSVTQIKGRWYYSSNIQDASEPKKWASMFELSTGFKDTSLDDQESCSAVGTYGNDLIFIMSRNTVWKLLNGDTTLEPQLISSTKGSKFPKSLIKIDEMLMYLSNEGPCYIEGDSINTMREFTASEVWPYNWNNEKGYFFKISDTHDVRSFYYKGTWWVHCKYKLVGMYMPTDQKGFGPMTVFPAWSEIVADRVAVLGFDKCCIISNHSSTGSHSWYFLDPDSFSDNGFDYKIRTISKGFYVNKVNPDLAGELYDMLVHLGYTDSGNFTLKVTTDNDRVLYSSVYTQKNSGALVDSSLSNARRNVIQHGFIEGLIGRIFQIEMVKEFRSPYDFNTRGFTLRLKHLPEQDFEYQHDELQADSGIHDALDDFRNISDWLVQGKIKDAGVDSRVLVDYIVRDAGDDTTRLLPS